MFKFILPCLALIAAVGPVEVSEAAALGSKTATLKFARKLAPREVDGKALKINKPGTVSVTWAPRADIGRHAFRIRHRATNRSLAVRRGASTVTFQATPQMIAQGNAFVFEVINLNSAKQTMRGKLLVTKPK